MPGLLRRPAGIVRYAALAIFLFCAFIVLSRGSYETQPRPLFRPEMADGHASPMATHRPYDSQSPMRRPPSGHFPRPQAKQAPLGDQSNDPIDKLIHEAQGTFEERLSGESKIVNTVPSSSNSTLGFGQIYVVSQQGSPRRKALLQAANVTELQLSIPEQPVWTAEDERTFRLAKDSTIGRGSLLAWLGHLNTLKEFLNSGAETALILEDDVDWDIRLRTTQAPLASKAVRSLISEQSKGFDAQQYPYGNPNSWDLIYFGHCGDYFHGMDIEFVDGHVHPSDLKARPHKLFEDPTMLPFGSLHPFTTSLLKNLGVGQYKRLVHQSVFPLCSFGYALSQAGARRLLELGSTEPPGAGHKAYDVLILLGCRDKGLRCWTVNPELFHHVPGSSIIDTQQGNTVLPPVDRAAKDQIQQRGETPNINCGFWKGEFSFEEDDGARLGWLQQEVGAKGRCLKDGRAS